MPNDQFARLLRFAKRTGDRLIVTDEKGGDPMVIMPLEQYESLITGLLGPDEDDDYELPMHGKDEEELEEVEIDPEFLNPPLEIVEDRPRPAVVAPQMVPRQPVTPAKEQGGEERFYLEPL